MKEQKINMEDPKIKQLWSYIQRQLLGGDEEAGVKRYIFYKTDPTSKNFDLYKDYSLKKDFELPTTGEKFVLTNSAWEINGIPSYIIETDRLDALRFDFLTRLIKDNKLIETTKDEKKVDVIPVSILRKAIEEHEKTHPKKPNIPIKFLPMEDIRQVEDEMRETYKIKEKLLTASETFNVHKGQAVRRMHPQAKLDFNGKMYILLLNVVTALVTGILMYVWMYKPEG